MSADVEYRTLVPGQQHFDCDRLRATLSTAACAARWADAQAGSACDRCPIGRLHHGQHHAQIPRRKSDGSACLRCGRTDLRIIKCSGLCVSCSNRAAEWIKGRNRKGTPVVKFVPPHDVEVSIRHTDGHTERRLVPALHQAEAVGRVLLGGLPTGARFIEEQRPADWNAARGEFEHVCTRCGTQGLILERQRHSRLERHAWCCEGDPTGGGWQLAEVRQQLMPLSVESVAVLLGTGIELEMPGQTGTWRATGHPCSACGAGQIEGMLTEPGGKWRTRCTACSGTSRPG